MKFKVDIEHEYNNNFELVSAKGYVLLSGTPIFSVMIPKGLIFKYPYGCDEDEFEDFVKTEFANKFEELLSN